MDKLQPAILSDVFASVTSTNILLHFNTRDLKAREKESLAYY